MFVDTLCSWRRLARSSEISLRSTQASQTHCIRYRSCHRDPKVYSNMNFELKIATKRKREEDVDSDGSYSRGNSVKGGGSSSSLRTDAADQSSADGKISIEIDAKAATALAACRTALITHRPFIDSDVVKLLETVGSYELNEVIFAPYLLNTYFIAVCLYIFLHFCVAPPIYLFCFVMSLCLSMFFL